MPKMIKCRIIKTLKKTKRIIRYLVLVTLSVFLLSACGGLQTWWAVRGFSKHAGTTIAHALVNEVDWAAERKARLQDGIKQRNHDHELLQAVYEANGHIYRFVKDHQPTKNHKILNNRIDAVYHEGVDLAPYQVDVRRQFEQDLVNADETLKKLENNNLIINEAEWAALKQALQAAQVDDLSAAGILHFIQLQETDGKFPALQKAISEGSEAILARKRAEAGLELLDAINFFKLCREFGVADDKLAAAWDESVKDLGGTLIKLKPVLPHYDALAKELVRYRTIAKTHQPLKFNIRQRIKPGSKKQEVVKKIQLRLQMEGYWDGLIDGEYDSALEEAVKAFQTTHQVLADGKVERVTLTRFNVTWGDYIRQIKLALNKYRHSHTHNGHNYFIWVNVGAQELEVYEGGGKHLLRKHRVIIGNRIMKNHTPLFTDLIEMIVFNPSWLVPERIIKEEMTPKYEADPEYFKKKGYRARIVEKDEGVVKIQAVTQPPGPGNALGKVKILFPNSYAVYLHDTPTKYLFKRALRPFSHGCVRLQDAVELARFLLEKDNNEFVPQIEDALKKRRTVKIDLNQTVPIYIEYITVKANEKGQAIFYEDVYKMDEEALAQITPE